MFTKMTNATLLCFFVATKEFDTFSKTSHKYSFLRLECGKYFSLLVPRTIWNYWALNLALLPNQELFSSFFCQKHKIRRNKSNYSGKKRNGKWRKRPSAIIFYVPENHFVRRGTTFQEQNISSIFFRSPSLLRENNFRLEIGKTVRADISGLSDFQVAENGRGREFQIRGPERGE